MRDRRPQPVYAALLSLPLLFTGLFAPAIRAQPSAPETTAPVIPYSSEQPTRARHGMVVSVHHLASDAGVAVMRAGGNAVDAAVATGFALAVTHPIAGNLGGGGFLLLRQHDGKTTFLDFRERAPMAASEKMYLDANGHVIEDLSVLGYKAIGTPGSVAGLVAAERKYGRLGLKSVLAPAIRLAQKGFVLTAEEAAELRDPDLAKFADSHRLFQRNGNFYRAGERFRQPELARTLQRIAADPEDFYHGAMARELVADLRAGGSLITLDDLAAYKVIEREPLVGSFHQYTILGAPPPSSGGVVLLEALNILESFDLKKAGDRSPEWIRLIAEAYRRAYRDRADYLGDPDFNPMPVAELTSKAYAAALAKTLPPDRATGNGELIRPKGFLPPPPTTAGRRVEGNHTTHYSVVDPEGNAVSVTTTLNDNFGSRVSSGHLGFLLNDEMDDFAVKIGSPNIYGLIQGPANAIAPLKRPLSSMTPTIVLEDGKLRFVLGSPGGARIISTVANIFLSATEGGLNIQQAVDAPRFHHQYLPDLLNVEPGISEETRQALEAMGYKVKVKNGHWSNGECIAINPVTGELEGGQDQRSHYGKASGW